jgi:hypothetical protein
MVRTCRNVTKRAIAVIPSNERAASLHGLASSCLLSRGCPRRAEGGYAEPDCHRRRNPSLTSSPPGTRGCHISTQQKGATDRHPAIGLGHPLVRALALHAVIQPVRAGSHLGSPLTPGRSVLTRGVSRRGGSVACMRADASPNEVLPHQSTPTDPNFQVIAQPIRCEPRRGPARRPSASSTSRPTGAETIGSSYSGLNRVELSPEPRAPSPEPRAPSPEPRAPSPEAVDASHRHHPNPAGRGPKQPQAPSPSR